MGKWIILLTVLISGCETEQLYHHPKEVCYDGVTYYRGFKILAPKFQIDGSLVPCEEIAE